MQTAAPSPRLAKNDMIQQLEATHTQQQDIVRFVDGMPKAEGVSAPKTKLAAIDDWCNVNSLETVSVTVIRIQERLDTLIGQVDHWMTQLSNEIGTTRFVVGSLEFGSGAGAGKGGAAPRDRNVFDPRDYKVAELGNKRSMAKWKKWCRDFECFVDTIGPSWKGTSGLLRQLRFREHPFDG